MYDVTVTHNFWVLLKMHVSPHMYTMQKVQSCCCTLIWLTDYNEKFEQTDLTSSCTSLPCTWHQGCKKNKLPKKVHKTVYSAKKKKVTNVVHFDPHHPSTVNNKQDLNKSLLRSLRKAKQNDSMSIATMR